MVPQVVATIAVLLATAPPPAAFTADCASQPTALAAALAASRSRAPGTPATITVTGTCRVTEPVTLSGPTDDHLTIAGAGDAPAISGGIVISSWKEHAAATCEHCGNT